MRLKRNDVDKCDISLPIIVATKFGFIYIMYLLKISNIDNTIININTLYKSFVSHIMHTVIDIFQLNNDSLKVYFYKKNLFFSSILIDKNYVIYFIELFLKLYGSS